MVQTAGVASAMSVTVHDGAQYPHGQDRRPSSRERKQRSWVRLELGTSCCLCTLPPKRLLSWVCQLEKA
eukprot:scaffold349419_cov17-Prasinocladus_malaysianus.AAC.1